MNNPDQFDNASVRDRPVDDRTTDDSREVAARQRAPLGPESVEATRARQREQFGGFNITAALFGWLVAVGLGVLLTAIAAAAGAALGLSDRANDPTLTDASTIGTVGAIVITAIGLVAYFCGGYVAGRMSRFDGIRQGLGVWIFGLAMTAIIGAAGAIFGTEYNVLEQLNLPRIPIDEGTLATAGIVTLIAVAVATLIGALAGGKTGEQFHRRVDRVGAETFDRADRPLANRD